MSSKQPQDSASEPRADDNVSRVIFTTIMSSNTFVNTRNYSERLALVGFDRGFCHFKKGLNGIKIVLSFDVARERHILYEKSREISIVFINFTKSKKFHEKFIRQFFRIRFFKRVLLLYMQQRDGRAQRCLYVF